MATCKYCKSKIFWKQPPVEGGKWFSYDDEQLFNPHYKTCSKWNIGDVIRTTSGLGTKAVYLITSIHQTFYDADAIVGTQRIPSRVTKSVVNHKSSEKLADSSTLDSFLLLYG